MCGGTGLILLPTSTHLLLQGTDILWTVAAAALINRERIGRIELSACLLCSVASTLLSLRVGATLSAPLLPLAINLASPLLLGLCISTLRLATVELMRTDGPLKARRRAQPLPLPLPFLPSGPRRGHGSRHPQPPR